MSHAFGIERLRCPPFATQCEQHIPQGQAKPRLHKIRTGPHSDQARQVSASVLLSQPFPLAPPLRRCDRSQAAVRPTVRVVIDRGG